MKRLIALFALLAPLPAGAQAWPDKPIHIIVAFTPGSATDVIGRAVSNELSAKLGQPVIIENKPGAGGTIAAGLNAIVCVGEKLPERDAGQAVEVVRRQVREGLGRLTRADLSHIIVAYEPVWAIGTGRTATPEIAAEMHAEIRKTFAEIYSAAAADALRILYGGSVKPENVSALMKKEDIDGALVGGASLDPASFTAIIKYS